MHRINVSMRMHLYYLLGSLLFFCAIFAQAEIYSCKDAEGNIIYTDTPGGCSNAEEVEVDTLPTLIPTKPVVSTSRGNTNTTQQEEKVLYSELIITSPSNDTVVRDNQGNVTINFRATPGLQTRNGHKFVVTIDGAEVYSGTSTIAALKNVDRGTHSIGVKVVNTDGTTQISATPVKFTLQRYSALQNSNRNINNDGNNGDNNNAGNQGSFRLPSNTKAPTRPATN